MLQGSASKLHHGQVLDTRKGLTISRKPFILFGERGGARTHDHRIKSPMLYQLSYPFTRLRRGLACVCRDFCLDGAKKREFSQF